MQIDLQYKRRPWQIEVNAGLDSHRFGVVVVHRRGGKTVEMVVRLVLKSLGNTRQMPPPRYAYVAPLLNQAKMVAWTYLTNIAVQIPGSKINQSELWVDFPNGAQVRLFGADYPDRLRGAYFDGVVMDEVGQMKPEVWEEVIRPALSDRSGWAVFIGTPKGINLFSAMHARAQTDPDWYSGVFPVTETGALPESEIELARADMSESKFRQEYLCDFAAANENSLIEFDLVVNAMGRDIERESYEHAPRVMGVDVARFGGDRSVIVRRQGLLAYKPEVHRDLDTMAFAGIVSDRIREYRPATVFVDSSGLGAGVADRLRQLGHSIVDVDAGSRARESHRFINLRAEMWWGLREWLKQGGVMQNDQALMADLVAPEYTFDPKDRVRLESKDDMKRRGLPSPDTADALAMTFAYPVSELDSYDMSDLQPTFAAAYGS